MAPLDLSYKAPHILHGDEPADNEDHIAIQYHAVLPGLEEFDIDQEIDELLSLALTFEGKLKNNFI